MEETFLRFPYLSEQIFKRVDHKSLVKCRKISKSWQNKIEKDVWIRKLQKITKCSKAFVKKILMKKTIKSLIKLDTGIHKLIREYHHLSHNAIIQSSDYDYFFQCLPKNGIISLKNVA